MKLSVLFENRNQTILIDDIFNSFGILTGFRIAKEDSRIIDEIFEKYGRPRKSLGFGVEGSAFLLPNGRIMKFYPSSVIPDDYGDVDLQDDFRPYVGIYKKFVGKSHPLVAEIYDVFESSHSGPFSFAVVVMEELKNLKEVPLNPEEKGLGIRNTEIGWSPNRRKWVRFDLLM